MEQKLSYNNLSRAERRAKCRRMSPREILADMTGAELRRNAGRGATAAITELERRENFFRIRHGGRSDFERAVMVEAMQPDWRQ